MFSNMFSLFFQMVVGGPNVQAEDNNDDIANNYGIAPGEEAYPDDQKGLDLCTRQGCIMNRRHSQNNLGISKAVNRLLQSKT